MISARSQFARYRSLACYVLGVLSLGAAVGWAETPRPNFVLIVADDLGFSDLGCYGGEIQTPHLDRLAAEGLCFTQFYNCAVCNATRAAMLTGVLHGSAQVVSCARIWLRWPKSCNTPAIPR